MIEVVLQHNGYKSEIRLPCTEGEISKACQALGYRSELSSELTVFRVDEPKAFAFLENKIVDLDELNYLAKRMESFWGESEFMQFFEALKYENFTELKDIINLTFNMNRYPLIQDISDVAKVGREYYLVTQGAVPANDIDNPKYAEKGRELIHSGNGIFTEHGLLFVDEKTPFKELYDGQVFPFYLYDSDFVLTVILEYNGKQELLCLPCEELAIQKACKRLKVSDMESLTIEIDGMRFEDDKLQEQVEKILREEGLESINLLANAMSKSSVNTKKILAMISYTEVEDVADIIKLVENQDDFCFFECCEDYISVAKLFILNEPENYLISDSLKNFLNYEELGKAISRKYKGKFFDGGFLCMTEGKLLENFFEQNSECLSEESMEENTCSFIMQ